MRTVLLIAFLQLPLDPPVPEPPAAAEPADAGPKAIALPRIIRSAEDVHRTLRPTLERIDHRQLVEEVQKGLPVLSAKIEPLAGAEAARHHGDLTDVGPALLRADETLSSWDADLESAVKDVHKARRELQHMDATWNATDEEARGEQAPPALLARVATVREQIRTASAQVQSQLDELLTTQDAVASVRLRIADQLAAVKQTQEREADQLFEKESVPVWTLLSRPFQGEKLKEHVLSTLEAHRLALRDYLVAQVGPALFLLGAFLLLAVMLRRGRGRLKAEVAADPDVAAGGQVLLRPVASAALLTLGLSTLVLEQRPLVVSQIILLGMLAAFLGAGRGLIPPAARRSTYLLAIIVAVHVLSSLTPEHSLLRRSLLLAVSLSASAVLVAGLRRHEWDPQIPSQRWRRIFRGGLVVGAVLLVVSALINLFGNAKLAELLATATLGSVATLLVLFGLLTVLRGLLAIGLRSETIQRWPVVASHGALFRTRTLRYLQWGAAVLWVLVTVRLFRIATPLWEAAGAIVSFHVKVGAIHISIGDILAFAITLWLSVLLARLTSFSLEEGLANRGLARGIPTAISRTAFYAIIAVGTVLAFLATGMEVTRFAVVVGTLGVGIGFGLQNVVNNFVSGLILLYERPIQVGDVIKVGDVAGTVQRIGIRSSTVANGQGAEVIVPNGDLISKELTNWTLSDRLRQITIDVSVGSRVPPEQVQALLLQVAKGNEAVLQKPSPVALLTGFNNGLNFQLLVWTERSDWSQVASDLRAAINRALAEAGIRGPENEVRVVSVVRDVPGLPPTDGESREKQAR
jgi:small-conductance mechanosensitive channel